MTEKRDAAAVRIFPPVLPLATVVLGLFLARVWPLDPGPAPPPAVRYWVGGLIIAAAILGLGLWAVILVRRSGQSENPFKPTTRIIEHGPYRLSRNPMYLQMVLACVGVAILLWNIWILLLTPVCAWLLYALVIAPEEAYLAHKFGDAYRAYRDRVRRWL